MLESLSCIAERDLCAQLFEQSARGVRKEAMQHADRLHQALQQQLEAGLEQKADAALVRQEGQSSRQQLSELWGEALAAREGLDQLRGSLNQTQGQVQGLQDKLAAAKVCLCTSALFAFACKARSACGIALADR